MTNRNNTFNNKITTENYNSNIINNNSSHLADGSLEDISPWLVRDHVIINKKPEKSKIPLLKTVITTELWLRNKENTIDRFKEWSQFKTRDQY